MNSRSGRAGAPRSWTNASKSAHISSCVRRYSARNSSQPVRSAVGYPEKTGGRSRVSELERIARDDAHPGPARRPDRRERDDVVLDDHVRPELVEHLDQAGRPRTSSRRSAPATWAGGRARAARSSDGACAAPCPGRSPSRTARAPPRPPAAGRAASAAPRTPSPRDCRRTTPRRRRRRGSRGGGGCRRSRRSCSSARTPPPGRRRRSALCCSPPRSIAHVTGAGRLRELLSSGTTILVPGAYNALVARILEQEGFDARLHRRLRGGSRQLRAAGHRDHDRDGDGRPRLAHHAARSRSR